MIPDTSHCKEGARIDPWDPHTASLELTMISEILTLQAGSSQWSSRSSHCKERTHNDPSFLTLQRRSSHWSLRSSHCKLSNFLSGSGHVLRSEVLVRIPPSSWLADNSNKVSSMWDVFLIHGLVRVSSDMTVYHSCSPCCLQVAVLSMVTCVHRPLSPFKYYLGRRPNIVIADPKMLRKIMVKDFSSFPNRMVSVLGADGRSWRKCVVGLARPYQACFLLLLILPEDGQIW